MLFIIGSILFITGISTFAWYCFTWKRDFSKRYSKLNPKCISNSMLKYKRKSLILIRMKVCQIEVLEMSGSGNVRFWKCSVLEMSGPPIQNFHEPLEQVRPEI